MDFYPYPSIEIPRKEDDLIAADNQSLKEFWEYVETEIESGLPHAAGCYIFAIRAGRGTLPWYVGKAGKQSFKDECFTPHKLNHFNNCIAGRKGTPLLKLVPKFTPQGRFSSPGKNGHREIDFLERMMIGSCIQRNPDLVNIKDTKMLREMVVPGLINNPKGRNSADVEEFKAILGVD